MQREDGRTDRTSADRQSKLGYDLDEGTYHVVSRLPLLLRLLCLCLRRERTATRRRGTARRDAYDAAARADVCE
jgi:hypothetical protein